MAGHLAHGQAGADLLSLHGLFEIVLIDFNHVGMLLLGCLVCSMHELLSPGDGAI